MNRLSEIIALEIANHGVISFSRFMELALYCPVCGFYEKEKDNLGRRGDFFTSVSVGSVFGELLALRFAGWLAGLDGADSGVKIVEAGAHNGLLAKDILTWLRRNRAELFERIVYGIVEPSPRRRSWQQETLAGFDGRVCWGSHLRDLAGGGGLNGIIFSNELLDAMPVRRIGWAKAREQWFEWGVTLREERFVWAKIPAPEPAFEGPAAPDELRRRLPDDFTTEICPAAENWWRDAAGLLQRGKLLTMDYGLSAEEFFLPERKEGTLRAYHRHRPAADVLANAGEQDLTAHVNFSTIIAAGESAGLKTEMFQTQAQFLTGILEQASREKNFDEWSAGRARQFQTLTHPEHLGRAFRVLVQSRQSGDCNS